jgi:uncharacterized membrane protein YgaE (UPF0421/DUF939 family)
MQMNDDGKVNDFTTNQNCLNLVPTMIDILTKVQDTEPVDVHTMNARLNKLHEDLRHSLAFIDSLPGTDLTRQQQEQKYQQLQQALDEKTKLTNSFQQLSIFASLQSEQQQQQQQVDMMKDEE